MHPRASVGGWTGFTLGATAPACLGACMHACVRVRNRIALSTAAAPPSSARDAVIDVLFRAAISQPRPSCSCMCVATHASHCLLALRHAMQALDTTCWPLGSTRTKALSSPGRARASSPPSPRPNSRPSSPGTQRAALGSHAHQKPRAWARTLPFLIDAMIMMSCAHLHARHACRAHRHVRMSKRNRIGRRSRLNGVPRAP